MALVALIAWIATAIVGGYMLGIAVNGRRTPGGASASHLPGAVLGAHPLLAVVGLVVWAGYLLADEQALAWVAFVALLLTSAGGGLLFHVWWRDRQHPHTGTLTAQPSGPPDSPGVQAGRETIRMETTDLAEQKIPLSAVVAHGVLGVLTIVLVLLVAVDVV